MEPQEYTRMFELEDRHWWFQGRIELIKRIMHRYAPATNGRAPRMLDLGCGTGMFLERQGVGRLAFGLDFSLQALGYTRQRGVERLVCGDSQSLPFASNGFDIVTAFDLIEHVDRDQDLVNEVLRVLRPGGVFIATVPAHPFLWSGHDVALHHRRRYLWKQFNSLFDPGKWKRLRSTYCFTSIYPIAAAVRAARRLLPDRGDSKADTDTQSELLNRALIAWHRAEAAFISRFDSPMGLSILTVQEKRSDGGNGKDERG